MDQPQEQAIHTFAPTFYFVEDVSVQLGNYAWVKVEGIPAKFYFTVPQPFQRGDRVKITLTKEPFDVDQADPLQSTAR